MINLNKGVLLLAGARSLFSLQKKTEICSLRSPLFFITEKDRKNRKKQKFARYAHLLASSVAILIMLAGARFFFITEINGKNRKKQKFARWRSPLFFITENNGKNRKKQKFVRYAHLLASSVAILIMLAGARLLFHYRNKRKKQKNYRNFCLRQANSTLTITLTLTWLAGTRFLILLYFIIPVHILLV